MEQDARQGVQAFMQRVSGYLQTSTAAKSQLYDIDFVTETPFSKPKRYQWESVYEGPRDSLSSLPSISTTDSRLDLPDFPVADEGEIQAPPESVHNCNQRII